MEPVAPFLNIIALHTPPFLKGIEQHALEHLIEVWKPTSWPFAQKLFEHSRGHARLVERTLAGRRPLGHGLAKVLKS